MSGQRILVVEDDAEIRRFLTTSLQAEGFGVFTASSGHEGITMAANLAPDLMVLDLGLPDLDGVSVVKDVRAKSRMPILILSARADERGKIDALDAGADDYVTKPFGIGELLARVRVALRRASPAAGDAARTYDLDGLHIDPERRQVRMDQHDVHLTPTEFSLLARLARSAGRVVTHRQLLTDVWGAEYVEHTHYLRIYMGQLRAKIEKDPAAPRFLLTETGVGYRLVDE